MKTQWKRSRKCSVGRLWMLDVAASSYATIERGENTQWWYWHVYDRGEEACGQSSALASAKAAAEDLLDAMMAATKTPLGAGREGGEP